MEPKTWHFEYQSYSAGEKLPESDRVLVERAREASRDAYAPYSGFRVGAAARLCDGRILAANNQESEAFPSGMCAERILLYQLQVGLPATRIDTVAIVAESSPVPCSPCGACRQVLADTEKRQGTPIRLIMVGQSGAVVVRSVCDLLPFTFTLDK